MVEQIREKISNHRKRIIPVLIALSLLSGLIVSILSTPNAQADYYKGCGYGYNSSGGGFGYGTGNAFGYGYGLNHVFGFGYGYQVCPPTPTTTTTAPVTTTTSSGGGGGTTTTTSASTTTTTGPTTTTTAPSSTTTTAPPTVKVPVLIFVKVLGESTAVSVPLQFRCTPAATCHVVATLEIPRPYLNGKPEPNTREVVLSTERFTLAAGQTGKVTFYYNAAGRSVITLFRYHNSYHLSLVTSVTGGSQHDVQWVAFHKSIR
jgi:hypothetical protein